MTGVAITILVKNPKKHQEKATIYYHDIGDYLKRSEKLEILTKYKDITNPKMPLKVLKPNAHGDWLNQRSDLFSSFIHIEPDQKFNTASQSVFVTNVIGVSTNRDAWVYNYSQKALENNVNRMIDFYNQQREAYAQAVINNKTLKVEDFIDTNPQKISWTRGLRNHLTRNLTHTKQDKDVVIGCYRPYCKQHLYYDVNFVESPGLSKKLFPTPEHQNVCIALTGVGGLLFEAFITNTITDLCCVKTGNGGAQCFPLYYYEEMDGNIGTLFDQGKTQYVRRDGITDFIFAQCRERYGDRVSKEDIFYYVYGLLHSPDYRQQFAADLKKMLPRIPLVDKPLDFWAFSQAGRDLAELHLNYETVEPYDKVTVIGAETEHYRVEKLSFGKKGKDVDKSVLVYNSSIRIENIPAQAYEYVINGKSAIEWLMDRYQVKTDTASGIRNDPNDWGLEHNNPRYILDLILSVINVSLKTMDIVKTLPPLELK
jgi:predicted helicase